MAFALLLLFLRRRRRFGLLAVPIRRTARLALLEVFVYFLLDEFLIGLDLVPFDLSIGVGKLKTG